MGGYAWVTLATNNSYSLGALVLAHSLKKANTVHKMVVLITPAVSQPMRDQLQTVFDLVKVVDVLDSKDEAHLALMKRPDLGITFTKIHCWRLVEFEKCVFLDADTLVVRNCDELFDKEEFSAAPDVSWPDCFNSGVFVYRPSVDTFNKILQFSMENRSFDGGDQGLLNQFFSEWATEDIKKHLPFVYNLTSVAAYSYIPAFKHYGAETRIVHFIGQGKPWLQQLDVATRTVTPSPGSEHLAPLLQQWWDLFCEKVHPNLDKSLESNNDGMSHPPVEARSNFLPIALTDEPQTGLVSEPSTPYREKDDFRQHNLPYLPFHVKGPSGELLNVEFLTASVVPPEERTDEQQRQEEEHDPSPHENEHKEENKGESNSNHPNQSHVKHFEVKQSAQNNEQNEQQQQEQQQQQQEPQKEEPPPPPPPPKDPFDYYSFFPDETCISSYLEKNVVTYQPFDDHHKPTINEPEPEQNSPSLPRFLTIPQNDQRQSGNIDTQPEEQHQPASEQPQWEPPQREPTPPREEPPIVEKRELSKSKSMSCFPCDVTTEPPPRKSIWKSQPDLNVDPNRRYSMPKLKPILPKQRSFSKSVPSAIPKVTLYTEFLISSEYKDPVDLPNDKIGFVETHIHKLRRTKSDADIRDRFGPLPYCPSPVTEKPSTPKTIPRRHFDNEYYDLTQCKRQMGNKPKPIDPDKRKETVHSFPALKPIVPAKDKKSTLIKKRKSKELSPGDGGREKILKREPKRARERKRESIIVPRNVSTNGTGNNLDEILKRLREFSKDYQHFFGVGDAKPLGKTVTCKNATVQASGQYGGCGISEAFETFSTPVSTRSTETQTPKKAPVENSEFRQFRNYIKDQKETSQKGLLGIQDILSGSEDTKASEGVETDTKEEGSVERSRLLENCARETGESNSSSTPKKETEYVKSEEVATTLKDNSIESLQQPPDSRPVSSAERLEQDENTPAASVHSKEQTEVHLRNGESNPEGTPHVLYKEHVQNTISSQSQSSKNTEVNPKSDTVVLESNGIDKDEITQQEDRKPEEENSTSHEEASGNSRKETATEIPQITVNAEQLIPTTNPNNEQEKDEEQNKPTDKTEEIATTTPNTQNGHVTPQENGLPKPKEEVEPRTDDKITPQMQAEAPQPIKLEKVKRGGVKSKKKPEHILCVPDFDTPRTSRVGLPDLKPTEETKPGTVEEPRTKENGVGNGETNGLANDSPDGTVRIVGKNTLEGKLVSPRTPSTPLYGNPQSESFEESKSSSGIAGAIAQLSLEAGSEQTPQSAAASSAQEEYLRRQNWETGNMDYMGRDSFDNIWSKICQTIEAKELEENAAGSPQPPTETSKTEETASTDSPVSLSAILQKCPDFIETLPGEPAAGPVEDDEIIFSKPENRQSCLTNITEEEEAGTEGPAPGSVKLSDILNSVPAAPASVPAPVPAPTPPSSGVTPAAASTPAVTLAVATPASTAAVSTGPAPASAPASIPTSAAGQIPASAPTSAAASVPASAPASIPASPTGQTPAPAVAPVPASAPASIPASPTGQTPASAPTPTSIAAPVPASAPASIPASPTGTTPTAIKALVPVSAPVVPAPASAPASIPASPTGPTPPSASTPASVPASAPASIPPSPTGPTPAPVPASAPASIPASPTGTTPAASKALVPVSSAVQTPASAPASIPASPTGSTPASAPVTTVACIPVSVPSVPSASTPASAPSPVPAATAPASVPPSTPTSLSTAPAAAPTPVPAPAPVDQTPTVKDTDNKPEVKTAPTEQNKPEEHPKPEPGKCTTVALLPQPITGQKTESTPQQEKKTEECTTVAIPSPPIVIPGAPSEDKPQVQSEPIPLPPPSAPEPTPVKSTRSDSLKEEGKQKKGVFTKILEMVGVAPKDKNGAESKSVFYVDDASKTEVKETEKPSTEVQQAEEPKQTQEQTPTDGEQKPGQSPFPKPARGSSPKQATDSIQVSATRRSPSPKLTIPTKPPETEITMPTPPPQPDVPPRKNSALLKVDETILQTPPVPEPPKETDNSILGKVTTEIEDIIGKAKSEVESLLQERRSVEKDTGDDLINTMKLLMGGEQPGKSQPEELEELRVTSEEERKRHKGEVVTSKLSDQILKAIPPPRRKAISEATASTSAIPKPTTAEPKGAAGEPGKPKPGKPSSIPVPPPRNRGKPTTPQPPAPAPSKAKGKK